MPEELNQEVEIWRRRLLEAVVLLDDDVLETYVETDDVPAEDIHRLLRQGTLAGVSSQPSAARRSIASGCSR
ncbi:MAG: hypothetical protein Ct9H300mP1_07940 [Planctomycetaceae bacterium]|nr:MAG: hypothetical protein Ct9H300mP1_07940 [Planctomycetaceae bacterium]